MKIAAGMAPKGYMSISGQAIANDDQIKNLFVHHVFFWLKEPENKEERIQFEKGIKNLRAIPQIQSSHIGSPVESSRQVVDDSFTYSYMTFFRNNEDQTIYQTHPLHLQFIEDYQHLWEKVIVYDAMS